MGNIEDGHRTLRLLEEISKGEPLTQRDLSDRAGVALGLVNSYIKNLVAKGYVKVSAIPKKRYAYYLTPKGFTEKSRLTFAMLQNYTRVFREARREYSALFGAMREAGVKKVMFAGVDEVAEIAYLSLHEAGIEFVGALDDEKAGESFFKTVIQPLDEPLDIPEGCRMVITTYRRKDHVYDRLAAAGVDDGLIDCIYPLDARKPGKRAGSGGGR